MSSASRGDHPVVIVVGVVAALATILTFLFQFDIVHLPDGADDSTSATDTRVGGAGGTTGEDSPDSPDEPTTEEPSCDDPEISLTPGRGPSGTSVTVTGSGFPSGERINFEFHTERLAPDRVHDDGSVNAEVEIPGAMDPFAPMQVTVRAFTESPLCQTSTVYALTEGG